MRRNTSTSTATLPRTADRSLPSLVRALQRDLGGHLDRLARAVDAQAVHDTRVAARRLLAVLRAFKKYLTAARRDRYCGALSALAVDLDAVRDADVAKELIGELAAKASRRDGAAAAGLCALAAAERGQAVRALRAAIAAAPWAARTAKIGRLAADRALYVEPAAAFRSAADRVLRHRRRRLGKALRGAGRSAAELHRLRLKIKALRYLAEQCAPLRDHSLRGELDRLSALQADLGALHDAWLMRRRLRSERRYRRTARAFCAKLARRERKLRRRFHEGAKRLPHLWRDRE